MATANNLFAELTAVGYVNLDTLIPDRFTIAIQALLLNIAHNSPAVSRADLSLLNIRDDNAIVLATHLRTNTHVSELILKNNLITDDGIIAIMNAIIVNKTIHRLDLEHNWITLRGAESVAAIIRHNECPLEYLSLKWTGLILDAAKCIPAAFLENRSLTQLDLSRTTTDDEGAKLIAAALIGNETLKALSLFGCNISDEGCIALAEVLRRNNRTLDILSLRSNQGITDASGPALIEMLRVNYTLSYLDLSNNDMTIPELRKLAAVTGTRFRTDAIILRGYRQLQLARRNNGNRWREEKHHALDQEYHQAVFNTLLAYEASNAGDDSSDEFLPWHDLRRVFQAWAEHRRVNPP